MIDRKRFVNRILPVILLGGLLLLPLFVAAALNTLNITLILYILLIAIFVIVIKLSPKARLSRRNAYIGLPDCERPLKWRKRYLRDKSTLFCFIWGLGRIALFIMIFFQPYRLIAPLTPVNQEWQRVAQERADLDLVWMEENMMEISPMLSAMMSVVNLSPKDWTSDLQGRNYESFYAGIYLIRIAEAISEVFVCLVEYKNEIEAREDVTIEEASVKINEFCVTKLEEIMTRDKLCIEWTPYTNTRYLAQQALMDTVRSIGLTEQEDSIFLLMMADSITQSAYLTAATEVIPRVLGLFILNLLPTEFLWRIINHKTLRKRPRSVLWVL